MQSLTWLRPLVRSSTTTRAAAPLLASSRAFTSSSCCCDSSSSSSASADSAPAPARRSASSTPPPPPSTARRFDLGTRDLRYLQTLDPAKLASFDPILDVHPSKKFSVPRRGDQAHDVHITLINDDSSNKGYQQPHPSPDHLDSTPGEDDSVAHLSAVTQLSPGEIRSLYRFPLITKRVVNMKSKGKLPAMYSLVVVGNGKGLVGVGEGKDDNANKAIGKAFSQAVRSMDYVERYEDRTVWGTMQSNFGSCQIQMRSRPPGFGLRVNHFIHQVAKAAGISDLSAKVYGSRNGTRVIKLAIAMLHGGSTPVDMGGFGMVKGQRKNKKTRGMVTAEEVARLRGRKPVIF